jgi:transcriptional regulator with XRE-family HTH domain
MIDVLLIMFDLRVMENNILKKFGNNVRKERSAQGISQEELAYRAGLHRTYIGMIERAEKNITLINIEKIALALKVEIQSLI